MARYIINFADNFGREIYENVKAFNQYVGQSHIENINDTVFLEICSQIVSAISRLDGRQPEYLAKQLVVSLMTVPAFSLLIYVETDKTGIDPFMREFANKVRAFGLTIYGAMKENLPGGVDHNYHYSLEERISPDWFIINTTFDSVLFDNPPTPTEAAPHVIHFPDP